jgi:hypothetical protein
MALAQSIIDASDAVRTSFVDPTPGVQGGTAKLPLTGFRKTNVDSFFQMVWNLFKERGGVLMRTEGDADHLDYGGWFNYFFAEGAKKLATDAERGRLLASVFALTVVDLGPPKGKQLALPDESAPFRPSARFTSALVGSPAGLPRDVLDALFRAGFEVATTVRATDHFSRDLAFKANTAAPAALRSSKGEYVFAYRGDTRDAKTVKQHQGAKCRADLDFWRKDNHLDAKWHPWGGGADDTVLKQMWFRMGAKDNDYFTLNSIAMDFHISCAYPMFRSFNWDQGLVGPVSGWNEKQRALVKSKGVKIVNVMNRKTGQMEEVLSDDGCIYVCTLVADSDVAQTMALNGYPESGVRNIPLECMLAYIRIKRYHHPPGAHDHYDSTRASPTAMTIKTFSWAWVRTEDEARATLGCTADGMEPVKAKMNNLMGKKFDISHTTMFDSITFDPDATAPAVKKTSGEVQRTRIGW